ncbi:hypothetical protein Agub_g12960 [Astrephomene gubernaculifera]|uniref:SOUL heme-binding protein n=1 Tax=Astrephomene gubernaculifera TaxID=47775 RepID=A0AAD3HRQ9_9CHLO|nr:hypothetical protein Agub_g12960 [Astrephomene gubernaculifera]
MLTKRIHTRINASPFSQSKVVKLFPVVFHNPQACVHWGGNVRAHRRRVGGLRALKPQLEPVTDVGAAPSDSFDLQAKMEFLREDLKHLFDDKGIDASAYEAVVDFRDPITRHTSLAGYLLNIAFLRAAFDPRFTLHDARCTAPDSITTRWTMSMRFTPAAALPTAGLWNPTITFTGTSTYVFNPASGKICRHIDTWDSIRRQEFFSPEGFLDFLRQLTSLHATPPLDTPRYVVLRRARDYEVRQYEPYLVAETTMEEAAGGREQEQAQMHDVTQPREAHHQQESAAAAAPAPAAAAGPEAAPAAGGLPVVNPAGAGSRAFNTLARYIFGDNATGARMAMTTPVFSDTSGTMSFVVATASSSSSSSSAAADKDPASLPPPNSPAVSLRWVEGGVWAARVFGGRASEQESSRQAQLLRDSLARDRLRCGCPHRWTLARYNDPATPPAFTRNEVLLLLGQFDTWQ